MRAGEGVVVGRRFAGGKVLLRVLLSCLSSVF